MFTVNHVFNLLQAHQKFSLGRLVPLRPFLSLLSKHEIFIMLSDFRLSGHALEGKTGTDEPAQALT